MGEDGTTTATRGQEPHPLSVQERMALKGWVGPFCGLAELDEETPCAIDDHAPPDPRELAAEPLPPEEVRVTAMPTPAAAAVAAPTGWPERPTERRVERRRAERRSLTDLVGGDSELFSIAVSRKDMVLIGCCTAAGLLAGYVIF